MGKKLNMHYLFYMLIIGCVSCKKNPSLIADSVQPPIETPVTPDPPKPNPPTQEIIYSQTYELGTGSGRLTIDGKSLNIDGNILIKVKGGKYDGISISNINGIKGSVTIQNDGLVSMTTGQMRLANLNNVIITGNGTTGIDKGFTFTGNTFRPVEVDGVLNNFTFQYASFKNIGDNVITYKYIEPYNGSEDSYSKNLKFLHIDCDNTGQFYSGAGTAENGSILGLIKNIEIAYLNFQNSPGVGSVVWIGNAENYDIHHNTINNINTANNNHNGIFLLNGNGKFHHNKVSNHQGNAIRAFSFSIGTTPKSVLIYNNIVFNSRKYSAFEVQAFNYNIMPGKSTYVHAEVFNNTCGSLNMNNEWQGNLVDVYGLQGGTCKVYNNLAYNLPAPYVIAGQVSDLVPIASNNLYFKTYSDAGIVNEQSFNLNANSPVKAKGIASPLLSDDFYGNSRSATPTIGAVE
ncbi:hypothetical protein HDC92_000025 [Pedobacter sp. AK017]|uniref:hypothetical protein n=1 Tax=Pedobacter sp. AK017 TaxID=2723073 RepID=UPI00161AB762|nr:hypothetical protein [Pedobacter sp. AK017]MBB5436361.1 hypothetical protein [Pedobacter sp. AK017]